MPLTNGDAVASTSYLLPGNELLDFNTAFDVLKSEDSNRDGIDVKTLIDSRTNGGLTYNDFLILPGYIGICRPALTRSAVLMYLARLLCSGCRP